MTTSALDWQALVAAGEADPWHEDRLRKFTHITAEAAKLQATAKKLGKLGGLTRCTPELLAQMPEAAD